MKKMYVVVVIAVLLIAGLFIYWRNAGTWSWNDYQRCADAGGATQESNPPTCFHPNGSRITPGSPK